jgi:hypothetical protein
MRCEWLNNTKKGCSLKDKQVVVRRVQPILQYVLT